MIDPGDFLNSVLREGTDLFTCVPCSLLKPLINYVIDDDRFIYIAATCEGEAVGIAAGSYLAGRLAVVMLQNSGLGNIVNPITSLVNIYKTPCLLIISHRGEPGAKDAVQHRIMGQITERMLDVLGIYHLTFPATDTEIDERIGDVLEHIRDTLSPAALVLRRGTLKSYDLVGELPRRYTTAKGTVLGGDGSGVVRLTSENAVMEIVDSLDGDELLISTTGRISRELFSLADRPNNFYMQGSMGYAASIGLGLALSLGERKIVVLDGDGAVLMKLGTLVTVGHYQPEHFTHVVLDNQSYGTTGGQPSVSSAASFPEIAVACGYRRAVTVCNPNALRLYLDEFLDAEGPSMLHVKVKSATSGAPVRPTLSPEEIRDRFMECINRSRILT